VAEVEKLTQTARELEEAVLAGGAAANAVRDYHKKFQEMLWENGRWHWNLKWRMNFFEWENQIHQDLWETIGRIMVGRMEINRTEILNYPVIFQ